MENFELFKGEGVVEGEKINTERLETLNQTETMMFEFLKTSNLRLERPDKNQYKRGDDERILTLSHSNGI